MDLVLENFGSASWWVSVVVVGVLVNLFAAYLKPWIDGAASRRSASFRARRSEKEKRRQETVNLIRFDENELLLTGVDELKHLVSFLLLAVLASMCFVVGMLAIVLAPSVRPAIMYVVFLTAGAAFMLFGLLILLLGLGQQRAALELRALLKQARQHRRSDRGNQIKDSSEPAVLLPAQAKDFQNIP